MCVVVCVHDWVDVGVLVWSPSLQLLTDLFTRTTERRKKRPKRRGPPTRRRRPRPRPRPSRWKLRRTERRRWPRIRRRASKT